MRRRRQFGGFHSDPIRTPAKTVRGRAKKPQAAVVSMLTAMKPPTKPMRSR